MDNQWLAAAEGWKATTELIEACKKGGLDNEWCDMKIKECENSYQYCMRRAKGIVNVIGDFTVNANGKAEPVY